MEIARTIAEMRQQRSRASRIGFVPTMGFLHEGHLSLVRRAKQDCGAAAVSIFVNPTQFGPQEDFGRYPRDLERDLKLLAEEGVDLVFIPAVEEMYRPGEATTVDVGPIASLLEGAARPGHFRGVATVVCKLLNIVQPTRCYFGQKDWQQTIVVRTMARDLDLPAEIVVCPTRREPDGLAMSSRNVYLKDDERVAATQLYRSLKAAALTFQAGETSAQTLCRLVREGIAGEPKIALEYVRISHPQTVEDLAVVDVPGAVMSLAARLGATRLIDNVVLDQPVT